MSGRPKFDWSFNFGQVIQVLTLFITLGGGAIYQVTVQTEMRKDIEAAKARALIYAPRVDTILASDTVQNERIGNLVEAVREIRKSNNEVLIALGNLREDMATVKQRVLAPRP